ncbi:uncharacterized protein EMH_0030480 [Eimeria mitis]|uniref:Uncharacterized protein n=1 Tax=Eimeria mitis TaxID=44415 RepID=U6KG16_9EIME|nr:uncharacterized protein EMH_0030480 [Eimeria mitis]CDJ35736.1 hypothetical protein, conserved [Eimeria mitis]
MACGVDYTFAVNLKNPICTLLRTSAIPIAEALCAAGLQREDWILVLISLGWGGVFAGAAAFNAWRSATRESRHPYLEQTKSMLQSNEAVVEYLGTPLEVKAVEEHTETFAPWKRLVLLLRGPKGCTRAFVCARRVGYSEEDLVEKFTEEEEGAWWSRPYILKQWLLQTIGDAWELFQLLFASRGTEGRERSEGVGEWEVTSLFVLAPQNPLGDDAETRTNDAEAQTKTPRVIVCKGIPADNPDWCNSPLFDLSTILLQWVIHHRHLHQLTARHLEDALKKRNPPSACVSNKDKRAWAPQLRLRYFTGQLSREAIDGVAHLEIQTEEDARGDPDFADMLQCELRLQARRPSPSSPFVAFESTLSMIQEPPDGDPPFPVVQTFALDPKALAVPAEA